MYTKYVSSKRADVKSVLKRKPLVRAIALALMAGTVAVPAGAWAATLSIYKFVDSNENGQKESSEIGLPNEAIYVKPSWSEDVFKVTTNNSGYYSISNARGEYKIWESPTQPSGKVTSFTSETNSKLVNVTNSDVTANFGVISPPQLPNVEVISPVSPVVVKVGETVGFTAKIADANLGDKLTYRYVFGDAGWNWQTPINLTREVGKDSAVITPSHAYSSPGEYTMTVAATDIAGWDWNRAVMGSIVVKVVSGNSAPTVSINPAPSFLPAKVDKAVTLTANVRDPDQGDSHTYKWTLGDGTTATTQTVSHTFATEGRFDVKLEVTDKQGTKGNASLPVVAAIVRPGNGGGTTETPDKVKGLCEPIPASVSPPNYLLSSGQFPTGVSSTSIVWIPSGVVVTGVGSVSVKAICNFGTLQSSPNTDITITATEVIANYPGASIIGMDGVGNGNTGTNGRSIDLKVRDAGATVGQFYNGGNIQAGRGGNGTLNAGHGGIVTLSATNMEVQSGKVSGGRGGDGGYSWTNVHGGNGGKIEIIGLSCAIGAEVASGDGGNATAHEGTKGAYPGLEGDMKIPCLGVTLTGKVRGKEVYIDPTVLLSSPEMRISGKNVTIYGGDDWQMSLEGLSENAITATETITLAVGKGSVIDLRDNAGKVLKAGKEVKIFVDEGNLLLDEGMTLESIIDAPSISVEPSKIIYHVTMTGTQQVVDKAGVVIPVSLTLHNAGPKVDTYTLSATSQNGWTVSGLPATVTVEGLKQTELNFNVTLPAEGNDVITVTATSQADSTVVATTQVQAAVEKAVVVEPEKVALTLTKVGEGTLTAQGIDCGTDCTEDYVLNTEVKLTATPANGYQFANWSGDCTSDTVTMDQAKTCGANFTMLRYTASGKLFAEPNMPLPGATVKMGDKTTTTDAHGNWQIDGLTNGNYTATVTKNGYTIPTQNVVVNGENLTFDLGVVYSAYGTIKDEQKQPVAGITITIGDKHTQTDAVGYWKLEGLPAGESTLIASKDGYKFAPAKFVLGDQEPNKELLVTPASTLVMTAKPSPWQAIRQGANVTYTYTLFNGGVSTATGVTFTETVPNGAKLVSLTAKDGGDCDAATLTCTLPDLTAGATAQVELVLQATDGSPIKNIATATTNEYPADVQTSYKTVKPHLSVTVTDSPDPVVMLKDLHYTATVELSPLAPETTAKDINLVMQLPKGLELKAVTTAAGTCDSNQFPLISCQLPNLSIATPDSVSQTAVNVDVTLKDAGLLVLTNEAKVTASNYPAHTVREKTNIFIPDTIKIDMVLVIDTTDSMQPEINGVYAALNKLIKEVPAGQRPTMALIEFKDDVRVKAFTQDTEVMLGAVAKLVAEGGGTCPEASAEALEVALKHLKDGGTIFLATDASPYPEANLENLTALIKSQNMKFNALITGDCTGEGDLNEMTK